jgi:hypothetical protein
VEILGVIMDSKLKYREHMARAASKGLGAVIELRRLKGLSPATARQLFSATVTPVVDYTFNVWRHECRYKSAIPINRVQKIGAQAIVGTFMTVATSVAEAEATIPTVEDRLTYGEESSSYGQTSTLCLTTIRFAGAHPGCGNSGNNTVRLFIRWRKNSKMLQWRIWKLSIRSRCHRGRREYKP